MEIPVEPENWCNFKLPKVEAATFTRQGLPPAFFYLKKEDRELARSRSSIKGSA